jgi:hypothetical protein
LWRHAPLARAKHAETRAADRAAFTLPATAAQTPHLSSTITRKASRSATEEEYYETFFDRQWLFRTRVLVLRRQDFLLQIILLLGGEVSI